ncbi:MAG TPA: TatD family hydrolase [Candidatus Levybacteria bacterium]|nr:TatD family hydrolase [Candidatus Levybacteria bacterium]
MVDSHCHLSFHKFEVDVDEVIMRAKEAGIRAMINVGTQISSSKDAIALAEKHEGIYVSVGVHPHHADKPENNWFGELEKLSEHPKVIAIGECGMDFFSYKSNGIVDPKLQEGIFRKQIELSISCKLPLQIHNRHAGKDVLRILSDYTNKLSDTPGVFHCFAGDFDILKGALDLGFYIGFDGNITYPGLAPGETVSLPDIAQQTPLDRILVETDSPYLTPIPLRGTRNEPKNAIIIAEFIAKLKKISPTQMEHTITQNFSTLFNVSL